MKSVINLASFLFAVGAVWEVTEKDSGPGNSAGNIVLVGKLRQTPLLLLCVTVDCSCNLAVSQVSDVCMKMCSEPSV